jgi:hypothetical protein
MKTNGSQTNELATTTGLGPADFPIGSPHSRAAARNLAEERAAGAMQDWITVRMEDPKSARTFARKLHSADPANPIKVRLIARTHKTQRQAEEARKRVKPKPGHVSLAITDDEQGIRLVHLLAERHGGVVIRVDVSMEKAGRK